MGIKNAKNVGLTPDEHERLATMARAWAHQLDRPVAFYEVIGAALTVAARRPAEMRTILEPR
jgi:hypothetical protein